ncbi:MAG: hypothetical protein COW24_05020 [Candidatus Kerfeldbacteria bacterium CG15_BIG_FIL_POST_REV_8_21_14_020_45_12]|uniref:Guanylate cyclase domain-containing protein n=1 Tax=Candidatus Kerfeldbacteria bacterium CG15_BIG_FIL_POST_REV_8_21_14_020_45_12 TaxID=2014247 RepID=A0A2M7H2U2_9BACT|nr:MAG: hypothetical protein COW24_05020 [Candidatus Kerfeldbacteria bacterium CG15_BIG_FIL_POST_REV_8_21_14_020_45_12]PJA93225.1 MAG: hypothetical protein CO132_03895 [Candidatus Kerfeldbacteria bacterium CG_4_9_14_3_um_filter_45_8]
MATSSIAPTGSLQVVDQVWRDVEAHRNLSLLVGGCVKLGVNPSSVLAAIAPAINGLAAKLPAAADLAKMTPQGVASALGSLRGTWVTLDEYNRAALAVVKATGHPWHLREIGGCSRFMGFGADALKLMINNLIGKYFSSPWHVLGQLPRGSHLFNNNKGWDSELVGRGHARLYCRYMPGEYGQPPREPSEDFLSLYHLIRGMNEALPMLWPGNSQGGRVHYPLVQLPLMELLEQWAPQLQARIDGGGLWITNAGEDRLIGKVVWAVPDSRGIYAGHTADEYPGEDGIEGVRLSQAITTPCTCCCDPQGEPIHHSLFEAGETFMINRVRGTFPSTIVEVQWNPTLGDLLPLNKGTLQTRLMEEHREDQGARALVSTVNKLALAEAVLGGMFPNEETAAIVADRVHRRATGTETKLLWSQADIAIYTDIVSSEQVMTGMDVGDWTKRVQRMFDRMRELASRHGVWLYKETGDGAVFIATASFGQVAAINCAEVGLGGMLDHALAFASELPAIVRETLGAEIRVGMHVGENYWRIQGAGLLEASGVPITRAARLEAAGQAGRVLVSPEVVQMAKGLSWEFQPREDYTVKHSKVITGHLLVVS